MIDFDDLEEEAHARVEAGDALDEAAAVALGGAEPPGLWRGGLLAPIPRNPHLPAVTDLPEKIVKNMRLRDPEELRYLGMRLFIFYGAGDNVVAWRDFINDSPNWLDVAVYEGPGHGLREAESHPGTLMEVADDAFSAVEPALRQHAREGRLEGAPFAFAGHSMGVQVMVEVAARARRQLGLEPVCVFPIDRGAPDLPLYTDEGYRLLCMDEPQEFFDGFNPMIGRLMRSTSRGTPETERIIRMWQNDLKLSQEHTRPKGFHLFHCDTFVLVAKKNFDLDEAVRHANMQGIPCEALLQAPVLRVHELNRKITGSGPESSAPWSPESYSRWSEWTTAQCKVIYIDSDHVGIKTCAETLAVMMGELSKWKTEIKKYETGPC